jgi:YesN/AraC family two-component response regulator
MTLPEESTLNSATLLIVEDEPDLREILAEILRPIAGQILLAGDGVEALEFVKSLSIDAVLSDINMPKMNGLQLLAEMRHLSLETPFVVLSAFGELENTREALRLNATDFIDKPCDRKNLREVVSKALELGVALRSIEADLAKMMESSVLPADELIRRREAKRCIQIMRASQSIYLKQCRAK